MNLNHVLCSVILASCTLYKVSVYSQPQPQISTTPQEFKISQGSRVVLPCTAKNLGSKMVIWTFVDHSVTLSVGYKIKAAQGSRKYTIQHPQDATDSMWNLQVDDITSNDIGYYKCHIAGFVNASVTHHVQITGVTPTLPPSKNVSDDFNVTDCCIQEQVSAACLPACHPRAVKNPTSFDAMALCSGDILKLLKCGADGKNHAGCCKRRNVADMCLDYCLGELPDTITDDHVNCLNRVMDIIACYEDGQGFLPGPPTYVSAVKISNQSMILVTWVPPTDNPSLVIGYRVHYRNDKDDHFTTTEILSAAPSLSYVIQNVQIDTTYVIYVTAIGNNGASQPSSEYYLDVIPDKDRDSNLALVKDCCVEKDVRDDCQDILCSTDRLFTVDPTIVLQCYSEINKALQCVTGQRDHSPCCQRNGLPDICLPLCMGTVPEISWEYTSCMLQLPVIDACVQEGLASIPGPPVNVSISVGVNSVTVTWNPAPGIAANLYTILYKPRDLDDTYMSTINITDKSNNAVISQLQPGTHYQLQVLASNDKGTSLPSTKIIFLTYERVLTTPSPVTMPPGQLTNYNETGCCVKKNVSSKCLMLCSYSYLSGQIDWQLGFECQNDLGKILSCASDGRDHTACCRKSNVPEDCQFLCTFNHGDDLNIQAIACLPHAPLVANCYREGVVSLPLAPANLTLLRVTAHTATLSWKEPDTSLVGISSYEILYTSDLNKAWQSSTATRNPYIINNLKPSTAYHAQVVSVNANGTSLPSPMIAFVTSDFGDDETDKNCNFTVFTDTSVTYNGVTTASNTNTMEECQQACEASDARFMPCLGFLYGRATGKDCILYSDKSAFDNKVNKTGMDLYAKDCKISIGDSGTNWTAVWHNRSDCCMKHQVSDECMPYCKAGDFSNTNKCQNDFNILLACANDGRNHTECCQKNNVPMPCLPLCAGQSKEKDAITALCLSYGGVMIDCFTDGRGKIPTPPTQFEAVDVGSDYITLSWDQPDANCNMDCWYNIMLIGTDGAKFLLQNGTKELSWKVQKLKPSTKYTLSAVAINQYGSSLPSVTIKVLTSAKLGVDIVIKKAPNHVKVGGEVDLICEVYGPRQYTVAWYFNNLQYKKGRQLHMSSLISSQEGNYTCSATDFTNTYNKTYFLHLTYKPVAFNPVGDSKRVNKRKIGILSCEFKGQPTSVVWKKDGVDVKELTADFQSYQVMVKIPYTAKVKATLTIYFVTDQSVGTYTCAGSNEFGNSTGQMSLTNLYPTKVPPTIPVPKIRNVSECCANNGLSGVCLEICQYEVIFDMVITNTQKYGQCLTHLDVYTACAADGKDHTKCCRKAGVHEFCQPFCAGGPPKVKDASEMLKCVPKVSDILKCIQTGINHLPSPPLNVRAKLDTKNVLHVFWDAPSDNAVNLTHYVLYTTKFGIPDNYTLSRKTKRYEIKNVKYGDSFTFFVVAENNEGKSQPSNMTSFTFSNIYPAKVYGFSVKIVNGNNANLTWNPPENTADITGFRIIYGPSGQTKTDQVDVGKHITTQTLYNLQLKTRYDFRIVAKGYTPKGKAPRISEAVTRLNILTGQSSTNTGGTGKQTGDRGGDSGRSVALGIGLFVLVLFLAAVAVAVVLYCRRNKKDRFQQAVSFENPQYGSKVQISGLPEGHYDNASQGESFGYAPLREEREIESSVMQPQEAAKLEVTA